MDFPQFVVIHTVKGFSVVNEAEVDVFLEFSCLFYEPRTFQMFKLDLEKTEKPEIKLPTDTGSWKNKGNPKKKKNLLLLH